MIMSNCKWNPPLVLSCVVLLVLSCVVLMMSCSPVCAADQPASPAERVLIHEDYESELDKKVQIELVTIPAKVRTVGLSTERARSGQHSVKIDVTYKNSFNVYLTPRRNKITGVDWGTIGGIGGFDVEGLNIPLRPDRGYVLTLYAWVDQASTHNPVKFHVRTTTNSDLGVIRSYTLLEQEFTEPTQGWVKVEQELTSYMLKQLEAQGYQSKGILLSSISMNSFSANYKSPLKVYIDDITLKEVPLSVAAKYQAKEQTAKKKYAFTSYPKVENTFVWGVYGSLQTVGRDWYLPYPRPRDGEAALRERVNRLSQTVDWILLDLRRHYCNTQVQGGGCLFPSESQLRYDYLKLALDKCAEYGVGWVPSTYVTRHYRKDASKAECLATMRKLTEMFKSHPGLFAYLLVDEPQPSNAEDFYWGKQQMEMMDTDHPCLSFCNGISSVREFSPTLPIVGIDFYPMNRIPGSDKGAWAVGDMVRYSRSGGAKRIWILPQVFSASSWRWSSVEEFRIQLYSSLAEGASGFLPFVYGGKCAWYQKSFGTASEILGDSMVDFFGNPSAQWDEMKKLGPYLRSVGPLLIRSDRLEDNAATAKVRNDIATNTGRKRPVCVAQMFKDRSRNARYLVVYNNTRVYTWNFNVGIAQVGTGEKLLDLYSLREAPLKGKTFSESLRPGAGRIYALAPSSECAAIKKEVATERFNIEYDLLKLETRLAKKMGTDITPIEKVAAESKRLLASGDFLGALAKVTNGKDILQKQNSANIPFSKANTAIEASRSALGRINKTMSSRMAGIANSFMGTDPGVKKRSDQMIRLADRFYASQTQLLQKGPDGLVGSAQVLLADIQKFERSVNLFFGM